MKSEMTVHFFLFLDRVLQCVLLIFCPTFFHLGIIQNKEENMPVTHLLLFENSSIT